MQASLHRLRTRSRILYGRYAISTFQTAKPSIPRFYSSSSFQLKEFPPHTLFPMPALSPTMETGTIAGWSMKEGDEFSAGDVLCSIETDKASVDFEAQDDGILAKILLDGSDAQDVPVGKPMCVVVEEAGDVAAFADFVPETDEPHPKPAATESAPPLTPVAAPTEGTSQHRTPSIRFLGKEGWKNRLAGVEESTEAAATAAASPSTAAAAPPPPTAMKLSDLTIPQVDTMGTFEDVPNNNMRKVIARRLTESKSQVPHFYSSVEVDLDEVMKLRKQLATEHDIKVSVNDLIIRSSALALRDVPEVNATLNPKSGQVQLQPSIDISVAVATPTGLITPIVPATDTMGLAAITNKVRDLAGRAREGKLQPEEYQGGTFCISNLGMFGVNEFSAVINPPQAAILAVGGGTKRIVPTPYVDGAEEQPRPSIRTTMTARLSADRRVVDEATAALFLSVFREYLSKPDLLLL